MITHMANEKTVQPKKRNHLRSMIIALVVFTVYTTHVIMAKGSADFIVKLLQGDFILFANLFMTLFVMVGWFLVYKYLGKLL